VTAAELLWPDSPRARALANLRSALWRSRAVHGLTVIDCAGPRLRLSPQVEVDHRFALECARNIAGIGDDPPGEHGADLIARLSRGLLPDWFDDWLLMDQERWDQIRLHTLETVAGRLMAAGRYLLALEAALSAVAIEPVRESAHRTVVQVYLAEGNSACALKHYQRYSRLVLREMGVGPSSHMTKLIAPLAGR
jgi:DNA-binding SARP family transcriptional activator